MRFLRIWRLRWALRSVDCPRSQAEAEQHVASVQEMEQIQEQIFRSFCQAGIRKNTAIIEAHGRSTLHALYWRWIECHRSRRCLKLKVLRESIEGRMKDFANRMAAQNKQPGS